MAVLNRLPLPPAGSRNHATIKFSGLPLEERLEEKNAEAKCGLQIINLNIGDIVNWVKIEGVVKELYDVVALPEARRPMALGFKTDETRHMLTVGEKKKLN